jgi:hypothetical protein
VTAVLNSLLPKRKMTTTRSFRVDEVALEAIEKDAAARNISVNTLVNQLLLSYANFDRYFMQVSMIKIGSDAVGYMLDEVSDEVASEMGRRTATNFVKSVILSKHGVLNIDTLLDYFRMMSDYGKVYSFSESELDRRRSVTLIHKWRRKGSLYYTQYITSAFEMVGIQPKLSTTEGSVTAVF